MTPELEHSRSVSLPILCFVPLHHQQVATREAARSALPESASDGFSTCLMNPFENSCRCKIRPESIIAVAHQQADVYQSTGELGSKKAYAWLLEYQRQQAEDPIS